MLPFHIRVVSARYRVEQLSYGLLPKESSVMKLLSRMFVPVAGLVVTLAACGGAGPTMPGPPELPITPPDPGPAPSIITNVADILSGAATGEVLVAGELSRVANASRDEWWFSDGTGEVVLDFASDHVPPTETLIPPRSAELLTTTGDPHGRLL